MVTEQDFRGSYFDGGKSVIVWYLGGDDLNNRVFEYTKDQEIEREHYNRATWSDFSLEELLELSKCPQFVQWYNDNINNLGDLI